MKTQLQIDVAGEEVYVNIASYAYAPETGPATIRVETREAPPPYPSPSSIAACPTIR